MVATRDNVEIPDWIKRLPYAPEFRPTETEFADPIAYISKIEKEASGFGICKIIPPLPRPSKKYVLHNLNKSLSKCPDFASGVSVSGSGNKVNKDGDVPVVFTTRHQELGRSVKKSKEGAQAHQPSAKKQVWQSGEAYTVEQFETKSKDFAKSVLSVVKNVSPLVVESMFWKADSEKPIYVEYANDVPGSCFGEPEGSHRHFLKRRRRRIVKKSDGETSPFIKDEEDTSGKSCSNVDSVHSSKVNSNVRLKRECSDSSVITADKTSQVSCISDMEGTAGWNLSKSPWNIQVISRSPGSLTRYMPDDIPGVTSPMVYIGMLFSWFAWHVEDHELHSLNYMHTGSPKTWYAVPGDSAHDFEEVIRTQAYGGNIDHFAALKLLSEKTTLLSPEIIVASGIPCCRLTQHPGEFVVTFPRAYHIGFSHGFNCGEAANFGTPQWLQVAKEAAVRRAASNHLPMLSHQQLLYLLTMSFVSRLPRSLLPGVRSSRMRDRLKEDREKSVKKAFIEDIVKENTLSTVLLAKDSSYRSVSWNPESMPSYSKEPVLLDQCADNASQGKAKYSNSGDNDGKRTNLFDEMSMFMETVDDLYLDDEDLSCDFQVGSGSLACVACGILGFPFVSIIQPSESASIELMRAGHSSTKSQSIISGGTIMEAVTENMSPFHDQSLCLGSVAHLSTSLIYKSWNISSGFLRPRIFCLEHAVQIERLLRSKGGANVLVICHSDYQKMKANARVIAEEIGYSFRCKEVPLVSASLEDLNLIDLAIDEVVHDKCGEDWTSKLGINLRHSVKTRKSSRPNIKDDITLSGLFSSMSPASTLYVKWQARRSRSNVKFNLSVCSEVPCKSITTNAEEPIALDDTLSTKVDKVIQYSRRNARLKSASPATLKSSTHPPENISATIGNLDKSGNRSSSTTCRNGCAVDQIENPKEVSMEHKTCHLERNDSNEIHSCDEANERITSSFAGNLKTVCVDIPAKIQRGAIKEKINMTVDHEGQYDMQHDSIFLSKLTCVLANAASSTVSDMVLETSDGHAENSLCEILDQVMLDNDVLLEAQATKRSQDPVSGEIILSKECCRSVMEEKIFQEDQTTNRDPAEQLAADDDTITDQPSIVPICKISDTLCDPQAICNDGSSEEKGSQETEAAEANKTREVDNPVTPTDQLSVITADELFKSLEEVCVVEKSCELLSSNETSREAQMPCQNLEDPMVDNNPNISATSAEDSYEVENNLQTGANLLCKENSERANMESGTSKKERKRKREEDKCSYVSFFRSPCEGLRARKPKDATITNVTDIKAVSKEVKNAITGKKESANKPSVSKEAKNAITSKKESANTPSSISKESKKENVKTTEPHRCHLNGCRMKFDTKAELLTHKKNHDDERPLKCPWKGCKKSFKWGWARTEHLRVHTGERPYQCKIEDCGLSFRFISDFSRHRRKTGHYVK